MNYVIFPNVVCNGLTEVREGMMTDETTDHQFLVHCHIVLLPYDHMYVPERATRFQTNRRLPQVSIMFLLYFIFLFI